MAVFNRLKNMKSIRHNNKEIVAVYANNKIVYQKDNDNSGGVDIEIDPNYNYFVFDTSLVPSGTTVVFNKYKLEDPTSWDRLTDWGDGTVDTESSHTYETGGVYTVKTKWVINSSYGGLGDTYTRQMLSQCLNINKNITRMNDLFKSCINLTYVNTNIDTTNMQQMHGVFQDCTSLTSLDLSNWNTSNIYDFGMMFYGCSGLTSLNLNGWQNGITADLYYAGFVNMMWMFSGCKSLTSINLSNFNTSNVGDMSGMFKNCSSLTSIDVSSFNTSKVKYMENMFSGCKALVSIDISHFDVSSVTDADYQSLNKGGIRGMFAGCSKLESVKLFTFNSTASSINSLQTVFYSCSKLASIDLSIWNVDNIVYATNLFSYCNTLSSLNISGWNIDNMTDNDNMFLGTSTLTIDNVNMTGCSEYTVARITELLAK